MPRLLLIAVLMVLLCVSLYGQENSISGCPAIVISSPFRVPNPGEPRIFTAEVNTGGRQFDLEYVWSVSHGTIIRGQGTLAIAVAQPPDTITATLRINGLPSDCPSIANETVIIDRAPLATKLDEFTVPIDRIEPSRIERIRTAMIENPSSMLYVRIGIGLNRNAGTRRYDFENALAKTPIDVSQITFVEVDSAKEFLQIWLVPAGASEPACEGCGPSGANITVRTCPSMVVSGPAGFVGPGEQGQFTATVDSPNKGLEFTWSLDGAEIVSGQGITHLRFRTADRGITQTVKATLTVKGLPAGCPDTVSETYQRSFHSLPTKLGEIWKPPYRVDAGIMNAIEKSLRDDPNAHIYIVVGSKEQSDVIVRNIRLQTSKKAFDDRVTIITVKEDPTRVHIYLALPGASFPVE